MFIIPLGTQTLGEEYCDIAQINVHSQTYPGLLVRMNLLILETKWIRGYTHKSIS